MNVTTEINNKRNSMGGGGSSRQDYLSASKSLNLSSAGNNINTAQPRLITAIPQSLSMKDSVGLFGPENKFFKLDIDIQGQITVFANVSTPENTYIPVWTFDEEGIENDFFTAEMDFSLDRSNVNDFEPARATGELSKYNRPVVSVELINLKTGNHFVDNWLDVQLYGRDRQPAEYDRIYTDINSDVYIGFHARNTKRLPYNVSVIIGEEYLDYASLTNEQRRAFV